MISILQLNMTQCLNLLRANPGLAIFPFPTQEFPLGVTRAALVAQFNAQAGQSGNFDANGHWNCQRIELNNTNPPYGESVPGALQCSQKYQTTESGNSNPISLPGTAPQGNPVVSPITGTSGAFNTGNFPGTPGEFSPAGSVQDVPPNTPIVGTPSATPTGTATVGSGNIVTPTVSPSGNINTATMVNTPAQVN